MYLVSNKFHNFNHSNFVCINCSNFVCIFDLVFNHFADLISSLVINQCNARKHSPLVVSPLVVPESQWWNSQSLWVSSFLTHSSEWLILLLLVWPFNVQINFQFGDCFFFILFCETSSWNSSLACFWKVFKRLRCWGMLSFYSN